MSSGSAMFLLTGFRDMVVWLTFHHISNPSESTTFRNNVPGCTFCEVIELLVCHFTPRAYRGCRRWKELSTVRIWKEQLKQSRVSKVAYLMAVLFHVT